MSLRNACVCAQCYHNFLDFYLKFMRIFLTTRFDGAPNTVDFENVPHRWPLRGLNRIVSFRGSSSRKSLSNCKYCEPENDSSSLFSWISCLSVFLVSVLHLTATQGTVVLREERYDDEGNSLMLH